jgi:hypothetical protein
VVPLWDRRKAKLYNFEQNHTKALGLVKADGRS